MTIEKFFEELSNLPKDWHPFLSRGKFKAESGRKIRFHRDRVYRNYCPITALYQHKFKSYIEERRAYIAGLSLGLSPLVILDIMSSADNNGPYREKLESILFKVIK